MSETEHKEEHKEENKEEEKIPDDLKKDVEVKVDEELLKEAMKEQESKKDKDERNRFFPEDDVYNASIQMMNFEFEEAKKSLEKTLNWCPMRFII
jgi:hypothetical protein